LLQKKNGEDGGEKRAEVGEKRAEVGVKIEKVRV
jgi:hypothetical protein